MANFENEERDHMESKKHKYNVNDISVIYPSSISTNFIFNKETKELVVNFDEPYMARMFELKIH